MVRNRDVAALVLSLSLAQRNASSRWKQTVQPAPGRFMHHLGVQASREKEAIGVLGQWRWYFELRGPECLVIG